MSGHLRQVERPLRWGRLESRAEIAGWAAERRETLERLCREQGLAEHDRDEPVQLEFWRAAA